MSEQHYEEFDDANWVASPPIHVRQQPPPLPPRQPSNAPPTVAPQVENRNPYLSALSDPNDQRSASTASLLPASSTADLNSASKRTLLIVYLHGFVGNEGSFRRFPVHLHELLVLLLGETHRIHSKVYPKYKTRYELGISVENFSQWLTKFESETTDIILVGHSMGGLLIADVALLAANRVPQPTLFTPRHRILGTVSLDTPFLGIHPGVIKAGLSSLFNPAPPPKNSTPELDPESKPTTSAWLSGLHFLTKHQGDLRVAAKSYITSHLEFGGSLLKVQDMGVRYGRIRGLEYASLDDRRRMLNVEAPRVRFINYYTTSTGRVKEENAIEESRGIGEDGDEESRNIQVGQAEVETREVPVEFETELEHAMEDMAVVDPTPIDDESMDSHIPLSSTESVSDLSLSTTQSTYASTQPSSAPSLASPPLSPISSRTTSFKMIEKERKASEARERKAHEKEQKAIAKAQAKEVKKAEKAAAKLLPKERTFCIVPKDDVAWQPILMQDIDEVGAHCGLFFEDSKGGSYERLLGDVGGRIEMWMREWMDEFVGEY